MTEEVAHTVGERAYRKIRDDILRGVLAPGAKLKLDQLRTGYGASTTTLREILSRLVSEKLVVAEGQRGFEVMPVSAGHLREIADLRVLLECEGLRLSFARGDVEWEGRVVAAHHRLAALEQAEAGKPVAQADLWLRFDCQFHAALISACGSHTLMAAHAAVTERYMRYQILAMRVCDPQTIQEHKDFVSAALKRDADRAGVLAATHVARGVKLVLNSGLIG